ncbi:MAG: Tyrosine-protein phosphatase YwqE [Bacteroidetes bacterium ADurb.Bin408]|nr:MAG: Tyrosine-protein phosphatase YwqE [Bacteroidetes bacterium ADurb.Bin408]
MENAHIYIPIEAAAEYLIDDGFEKIFKEGRLLTMGKKYILVELSYYNMHHGFYALVFDLQIAGYQVILAHPERYSYFHDKWPVYEDLKARGILFQLNTISLTGCYSPKVQKVAEKLIDMGFYDFVATDMHNEEYLANFNKSLYIPHLQKLVESGRLMNHNLI